MFMFLHMKSVFFCKLDQVLRPLNNILLENYFRNIIIAIINIYIRILDIERIQIA